MFQAGDLFGLLAGGKIPVVAHVVGGQPRIRRELAGEQPTPQRPANDRRQIVLGAQGQHGVIALEQVQAELHGGAMLAFGEDARPLRVVGAPAVVAYLARADQVFERLAHLERLLRIVVAQVKLVEVNHVGVEAAQRCFAGADDGQR